MVSLQDGWFLEAWRPEVSRMVGSWKPGGQKSPGWLVLGSLVVRCLQDEVIGSLVVRYLKDKVIGSLAVRTPHDGWFLEARLSESPGWLVLGSLVVRCLQDEVIGSLVVRYLKDGVIGSLAVRTPHDGWFLEARLSESPGWLVLGSLAVRTL